jgi:nitronate monooxygenase
VDNDERGTHLIFRSFRNTARVGKNAVAEKVVAILKSPDARFEDVAHLVRGAQGRVLLETGDLDAGLVWAGQVQGLIHDIPTVADLIQRIMREATEIIRRRLPGSLE